MVLQSLRLSLGMPSTHVPRAETKLARDSHLLEDTTAHLASMATYLAQNLGEEETARAISKKLAGMSYELKKVFTDLSLGYVTENDRMELLLKSVRLDMLPEPSIDAVSKESTDLIKKVDIIRTRVDSLVSNLYERRQKRDPAKMGYLMKSVSSLASRIDEMVEQINYSIDGGEAEDY